MSKVNDYDTINEALLSKVGLDFVNLVYEYFEKRFEWNTFFEIISSDYQIRFLDYFILAYYIYKHEGGKEDLDNNMNYLKSIMTYEQVRGLFEKIAKILVSIEEFKIPNGVRHEVHKVHKELDTIADLVKADRTSFTSNPNPVILKPGKRDSLYYTLPSVNDEYTNMYVNVKTSEEQERLYNNWYNYMRDMYNTTCISPYESLIDVPSDKPIVARNVNMLQCKGIFMGKVSLLQKGANGNYIGHANVILFNRNKVYLFDPNGEFKKYKPLKIKLKKNLDPNYYDTSDFFKFEKFGRGPQYIEHNYSLKEDERGYCFVWSLMFMEYITKYPQKSLEFLYRKIMRRGDLKSLVRRYLSHIMDLK